MMMASSKSLLLLLAVVSIAVAVATTATDSKEQSDSLVRMEFDRPVRIPEGWTMVRQAPISIDKKYSFLIALKIQNKDKLEHLANVVSSKYYRNSPSTVFGLVTLYRLFSHVSRP